MHRWIREVEVGPEVCPGVARSRKGEEGLQAEQLIGAEAREEEFAKVRALFEG